MNFKSSGRYVTLGETMLRLSPVEHEVLMQSPRMAATFGGAEANVAVSLANYGESVSFVSAAPSNQIGDAMVRELRGFGVDTSFVLRSGERMGIYYAECGASMRASKVLYDRAHSSFAEVAPGAFDWDAIFDGAKWFHTTGISPAVSAGAAGVVLEAMREAKERGVVVSCDLNYRKKLWKWGRKAKDVMRELAQYIDVMIANEEDCQQCLGLALDVDICSGSLDTSKYIELASRVMDEFPNVSYLAVSLRESVSADWNNWSILLASQVDSFVSRKYEIRDIVDRIGGGDSFGAGLIWGLSNCKGPQESVEFAAAASALKHTVYGDYNRVSLEDVFSLADGNASGRVQR